MKNQLSEAKKRDERSKQRSPDKTSSVEGDDLTLLTKHRKRDHDQFRVLLHRVVISNEMNEVVIQVQEEERKESWNQESTLHPLALARYRQCSD